MELFGCFLADVFITNLGNFYQCQQGEECVPILYSNGWPCQELPKKLTISSSPIKELPSPLPPTLTKAGDTQNSKNKQTTYSGISFSPQHMQSLPTEKITKKPIPEEHLILKTTFEALIQRCLSSATDPVCLSQETPALFFVLFFKTHFARHNHTFITCGTHHQVTSHTRPDLLPLARLSPCFI